MNQPLNLPKIVAAPSFVGLGVITSNVSIPLGERPYLLEAYNKTQTRFTLEKAQSGTSRKNIHHCL